MKILILNWRDFKNPKAGGAEIVTYEHAKAWVTAGHSVTWLASSFPQAKKKELVGNISIIRKGNWLSIYIFAPLYYLLSKNTFDIVIDEFHGLPFFTPLYVRKPKIAFIHEIAGEIWDYMFPFPVSKVGKWVERMTLYLYRNIQFMTVSQSTEQELRKLGIRKVSTIINGISSERVQVKKETTKTFIFVSRIVKMKGIEEVVEAFKEIYEADKESKLWIVGGGDSEYIYKLQALTQAYNIAEHVHFWGKVSPEKRNELMARAHLLLHASVKEGWGLVVVEAAAQGTPAVVYNVAGLRDSVIDNHTGIVLHKNNPTEMAKSSLQLLNDKTKYNEFRKNCIERVKSLTWENATTQSIALLNNESSF